MRGTRQLSFRVRALAFLMRRMPTRIRKFAWWWDRMYRFIGAGGFEDDEAIAAHWPDGLQGPIWSRRFGYRLYLDLRSFAERRTYFSGAGSQEVLEDLFPLILRRGDQYIDIGANIGVITLMASTLIGRAGRGFAFEPNPEVFARLKRHLDLNRIVNVEAIPFAVADQEFETQLVVPGRASGCGSLAFADTGKGRSFSVRTVSGRSYAERLDRAKPTIIKIDAEGYEVKALRGLGDFLDAPELIILAEVNPPLLRLAGNSPEELIDLMSQHGFRPLAFDLCRDRFRTRLTINNAVESFHNGTPKDWDDLLFVKPDSNVYRERIVPFWGTTAHDNQTA